VADAPDSGSVVITVPSGVDISVVFGVPPTPAMVTASGPGGFGSKAGGL